MPRIPALLLLLSSSIVLAGCERIQSTLGIGKRSPDPLRVIRQDPLAVPPNLELRPPLSAVDAASRPEDDRTSVDAPGTAASKGEAAILDAVAAHAADPQVRQLLARDQARRKAEEEDGGGLLGMLNIFDWFGDDEDDAGAPADPPPEAIRTDDGEEGEPRFR